MFAARPQRTVRADRTTIHLRSKLRERRTTRAGQTNRVPRLASDRRAVNGIGSKSGRHFRKINEQGAMLHHRDDLAKNAVVNGRPTLSAQIVSRLIRRGR